MKVLVVEDDVQTAEMIRNALISGDNIVEVVNDGGNGAFLGKSFEYDAILMDYSLPKKDGLSICREIRSAGRTTPILFLSVNDDNDLKVAALEAGADDYVTKPFSMKELQARLKAICRRPAVLKNSLLTIDDLSLDTEKHTAARGPRRLRLTRKEFNLLEYFMKNKGVVLSRALIMEHVWTAESNPFSNTVEAHIRNLRKKLNLGKKPNLIMNLPGRGYVMDGPENLKNF